MLQRAASKAYSWWWASHIRTKQSKWLEENLQDMEEKVKTMMKIIDNDGDSFAVRAEMYYKSRPELVAQVQESYRAYRALAEKYDHLSKDMQRANRTIAAVFPEQFHLSMEDDDDYEGNISTISIAAGDPNKANSPEVPAFPKKELRSRSMLFSRKEKQKTNRSASLASKRASRCSGLTFEEATEEIDKIQKHILALQTEREFMQSICERCSAKCSEIESQINDKQARVSDLQDEFRIGNFIDDHEARTLMAATALKSCKEAVVKLQGKQEVSGEKAKVENLRVKDLVRRFSNLQGEFHSKQTDSPVPSDEQGTESEESDRQDVEMQRQKLKKEQEAESGFSFTVMQLAGRIDELVEKVIRLETEVSSQNALINVLRSEADGLQDRITTLEEEKEILTENSEIMANKIKELEEELRRLKSLNERVKEQHVHLQTKVIEASSNVDYLSDKLENVTTDEQVDNSGRIREMEVDPDAQTEEEKLSQNAVIIPGNPQELTKEEETDLSETGANVDNQQEELGIDGKEDEPNWNHMLAGGLEEREKNLVEEYILVLRNYKDVKKRLGDVEKKNRDGFFELTMKIRELKNALSLKDEEIQLLRRANSLQKGEDENSPRSPESIRQAPSIPDSNYSTITSPQQDIFYPKHENPEEFRSITRELSLADMKISIPKKTPNAGNVDTCQVASAVEEKLRSAIDGLLEENLEFWLRFSTSFHQINKYQSSVQDLKAELSKLKDGKRQEGSGKGQSTALEARSVYRHLREIQTELTLWLESTSLLKDEQQSRYASLCSMQEEVSRFSSAISDEEEAELSEFQAAKFQGEILNMKHESNKVSGEIQSGLERAKVLKDEVEKLLMKMDEELGLSAAAAAKHKTHRARIPLRSFLFGVKLKTHKRQSSALLSCRTPERHDDLPVAGHQS